MHRSKQLTAMIIFGLAIFLTSFVQPVSAHTLQWGLMPSCQFEYSASGNRKDIGVVDLDYSLTITAFESIPVSPIFPSDFPRTTITLKDLADNSTLDMGSDISSLCFGSFSAMPIGDWSSLSAIVEAYSGGVRQVVAFENSTHWGYSNNAEDATDRVLQTTIYLKSTGIMVYYTGYHWSFTTQEVLEDVTIKQIIPATTTTTTGSTTTTSTTTGGTTGPTSTTPNSGDFTSLLMSMAGAAGIIAVAGVVGISMTMKRRHSQPPMPDSRVLVICPYCGAKTDQGVTRCAKCGADL